MNVFDIKILEKTAYLTFVGEIDKQQLTSAYKTFISHERFDKSLNSLWDFSAAHLYLGYKDLNEIAEQVVSSAQKRSETTCSAFVTDDEGNRSILETYITKVSRYPTEFKLFKDLKSAKNWLLNN